MEIRKIVLKRKDEEPKTTEEVHKELAHKTKSGSKARWRLGSPHSAKATRGGLHFFSFREMDTSLLVAVILVTLFGLFMIYDASSIIAYRDFHDKYHYIKDQLVWFVLGVGSLFFFSFFSYKRLQSLALIILLAAVGMLLAYENGYDLAEGGVLTLKPICNLKQMAL